MHPAGSLKELALRKALLQARIELRRFECVAESRLLVEPLEKVDVWRERLRRIGPYLPFGLAVLALWRRPSAAEPARPRGRGLLGWLPVVFQGVRAFQKIKAEF